MRNAPELSLLELTVTTSVPGVLGATAGGDGADVLGLTDDCGRLGCPPFHRHGAIGVDENAAGRSEADGGHTIRDRLVVNDVVQFRRL